MSKTRKTQNMKFEIIDGKRLGEIVGTEEGQYGKPQWGYLYPASCQGGVGARVIYQRGYLDWLSDRAAYIRNGEPLDRATLVAFNELGILQELQQYLQDNYISTADTQVIYGEAMVVPEQVYRLLATPNGSYGYVYLSFWRV